MAYRRGARKEPNPACVTTCIICLVVFVGLLACLFSGCVHGCAHASILPGVQPHRKGRPASGDLYVFLLRDVFLNQYPHLPPSDWICRCSLQDCILGVRLGHRNTKTNNLACSLFVFDVVGVLQKVYSRAAVFIMISDSRRLVCCNFDFS